MKSRFLVLLCAALLGEPTASADGPSPTLTARVVKPALLHRSEGLVPQVEVTNTSPRRFTGELSGCVFSFNVTGRARRVVLDNTRVTACPTIHLPLDIPPGETRRLSLDRTIAEIPTQRLSAGSYILNLTLNVYDSRKGQSVLKVTAPPVPFVMR